MICSRRRRVPPIRRTRTMSRPRLSATGSISSSRARSSAVLAFKGFGPNKKRRARRPPLQTAPLGRRSNDVGGRIAPPTGFVSPCRDFRKPQASDHVQLTEEVPLAQLDAFMAQDRVGHADVEV